MLRIPAGRATQVIGVGVNYGRLETGFECPGITDQGARCRRRSPTAARRGNRGCPDRRNSSRGSWRASSQARTLGAISRVTKVRSAFRKISCSSAYPDTTAMTPRYLCRRRPTPPTLFQAAEDFMEYYWLVKCYSDYRLVHARPGERQGRSPPQRLLPGSRSDGPADCFSAAHTRVTRRLERSAWPHSHLRTLALYAE